MIDLKSNFDEEQQKLFVKINTNITNISKIKPAFRMSLYEYLSTQTQSNIIGTCLKK